MNLPPLLRMLLWPLSLVYGIAVSARTRFYAHGWLKQKRLKGTVISVGNLTVGGTGKTPMVIWLAEKFLAEGKRVAILSRGYRGTNGTSDEIELMKSRLQGRVSFGVGKNRFAEGHRLESEQPIDIFLLDDGFQHLQLARQLDILLVDASRPLRSESLLPSGRLREPLSAIHRADLVVFTRVNEQLPLKRAIQEFPEFPIFPAATRLLRYQRLTADQQMIASDIELPPQPVFVFCGIGNPDAFLADVDRWGNCIAGRSIYRDHHSYTAQNLRRLEDSAKKAGARSLLTTEKDAQNLGDLRSSSLPVYYCEIAIRIADTEEFQKTLERKLDERKGIAA
ncbi:MAG: tetraacyldisaccharide 4'-kinase [Acidobacteria bacterium 13_1_40CM_4_57_6]|nr:MAG: tetraacyldisaccharide 4'-kinase [Acidobacteria bacterium 13_1_40CM_4_57_6]